MHLPELHAPKHPLTPARQAQAAIKFISRLNMSTIKLFETKQVRSLWDAEKEAWFFSIVDVIAVLTDSTDAGAYWRKPNSRLQQHRISAT
jgi:hypothetical protein